MKPNVVITGMGAISALGLNVASNWQHLTAGKSGVRLIDTFDTSAYSTKFAATANDFQAADYFDSKEIKKNDRFILLGLQAANEAIKDAGILSAGIDKSRVGVSIGSGIGGIDFVGQAADKITQSGPRRVSPFFIPGSIINMVSGNLSIMHGFLGPNIAVTTACTTATHAIGLALRTIAYGDADIMVCGGSEAPIGPLGVAGFNACRALSTRNDDPTKASRPWDKNRDGFVLGEGAGVLVLESEQSARKRGAKIYAQVAGFGMAADGYHMTMPHPEGTGAARAMRAALADANLAADSVDYINAHATSTLAGDLVELKAIGSLGVDNNRLVISATKSMTGHLLGAAGAIEAIYTAKAVQEGIIPPTINLDTPDDLCADYNLCAHKKQSKAVRVALSNSFAFGGTNATLVLRSYVETY